MIKLKNLLIPLMVILFLAFALTADCTVTLMQAKVENIKYLGLSSDDKPTTNVPSGSLFFETDTLREYIFDLTNWNLYRYEGESGFDITDYPNFIRGQGGTTEVVYSDEVASVAIDTDVELLLWKSETNYPYIEGNLTRVWYEVSFQLKAANDSADVIYQLQAKDKDGEWIDMSAAVTCTDLGTSYVAKLIKGYMDIQSGASLMPFEMRLIIQSNESDIDLLVSFSCTWASQAPGGSGSVRAAYQYGTNLYISIQDTIYYQTGTENYTACTGSMGQVRSFAVSDVSTNSLIYAATNTTVKVKGAGASQVWAAISGSPDNCWSTIEFEDVLFFGMNSGEIRQTANGADFTTAGSAGSSAIRALMVWGDKLYAGSADGDVYVWDKSTTWTTVHGAGLNTLGITEVYALAVHTIGGVEQLYVGGLGTKIGVLAVNGSTWSDTGSLAGNASRVFALISFSDTTGYVLYAATGNGADVDYWDNSTTWTNTGELSGDYQVLCLAVYTTPTPDTIYAGSSNWAKIWKATITSTWESGEATGRVKNDREGQETLFEIIGRFF